MPLPQQRGRKRRGKNIYSGRQLVAEHLVTLDNYVQFLNATDGGVTVRKLRKKFSEEHNLIISRDTMQKVLRKLGYVWVQSKKVGLGRLRRSEDRKERIREFTKEYSESLGLEDDGSHIVVFMDETFVHQRHSANYTWFHPDHASGTRVVVGSGNLV